MSSFSTNDSASNLVEGTKSFFGSMIKGDFQAVEDLLSPDCRLQDQFKEGRGVVGIENCMEKIREAQSKFVGNGLSKMESTTLMRNQRQVRFMLNGKVGFIKVTIGFAVEWSCGIITLIVIVKSVSETVFLTDDTIAPPVPVPTLAPPTEFPFHEKEASADEESNIEPEKVVENPVSVQDEPDSSTNNRVDTSLSVATSKDKEDKWYPGKHIRRRTIKQSATPVVNPGSQFWELSRPGDFSIVTQTMGLTLEPPYLVPRPPPVAATINVTVLGCTGLKSRMVRLIERPINSYVSVLVAGRTRRTPEVSRNRNPDYSSVSPNGENMFIFELPNSVEFRREGCIEFTIKDRNLRDEDVLAELKIPLVSIKCATDHSLPTSLHLPLQLFEKHTPRIGKGFRSRRERTASQDGKKSEEIPHLDVSVSKVDIMQWWVLEEIRARDLAREKALAEEKVRKAIEAERKMAEEMNLSDEPKSMRKPDKVTAKKAVPAPGAPVIVMEERFWADGVGCFSCNTKFSFTVRKHHCRICGEVFCAECSDKQVMADSKHGLVKVCDKCYELCTTGVPASTKGRIPDSDDEEDPAVTATATKVDNHESDAESRSHSDEGSASSHRSSEDDETACVIS